MHSTLSKIVFVKYTLHNHPLPLVSVTFCLNIKHSAFWDAPYTSICSATRSRTFSRHYWFTLSLALHSQSHYRGRPSSSFCSLCLIWAAFYSPPVSLEVNRREKVGEKKKKERNERKCLKRPNLCRAKLLHGSMSPPETAHRAPLHFKRSAGKGQSKEGCEGKRGSPDKENCKQKRSTRL